MVAKRPGYRLLTEADGPPFRTQWPGACIEGPASGLGTIRWTHEDEVTEFTGLYRNGRGEGVWVERFSSGLVREGPFVNGTAHSEWISRDPDGTVVGVLCDHGKIHSVEEVR